MSSVTLPGTLPGLLRRGAPICGVVMAPDGADVCIDSGLVYGASGPICAVVCGFASVVVAEQARIHLDLTDPAGMDIAARWLAAKVGLTVGATAPTWVRWEKHDGVGVWSLRAPGMAWCFANDLVTDNVNGLNRGDESVVPGISTLTNPAEALALACMAVSK